MRTSLLTYRWCLAAALLAAAATPLLSARPEPQAGGSAPVLIDFRVVTDDGNPVEGLKPADVTVRIGGRARPLRSLEFVRIGGEGAGAPAASPLPPPYVTNAAIATGPGTRREILIVIDELSISPGKEPPIRESLHKLLTSLTPADRVGVLSTRQGGTSSAFTQEHEQLRSALAKFSGYAPGRLTDSDFACNAVLVLNTLKSAFSQFTPSSAPTLVFVSAAVAGPASERMATIGRESELCPLRTTHYEEVGVAAYASHANVYVVHALEAATTSQTPQAGQAGIDAIAGSTGGETIRMTGGTADTSLTRIARETSAYYLAAFDAEPGDRGGSRQRVEVRVAREGVRVSAPPHLVVPKGGTPAGKPLTPREMIRVPTKFTDLPLRSAVYTSKYNEGQVRLVVLFESADPAAKLTAATIVAFDAKGTGRPWNAEGKELAAVPIRSAIDVQPGPYRVRIAATDQAGRAGSVDVETQAQLVDAGALKLSSLVLGVASGGTFAPRLQFDAGDQQAIGYVEIYGVSKDAKLGVTFELAQTDGGPAIATGAAQISAGSAEDARIAFGGFGIGPMTPGDLQMRAVITLDGKRVGSVSRTVRKTS